MTQPRRPSRAASCQGKTPLTAKGAKEAMRVMKSHGIFGLRPYRCEFCGKWHVGHGVARQEGRPKPPADRNEGAWRW